MSQTPDTPRPEQTVQAGPKPVQPEQEPQAQQQKDQDRITQDQTSQAQADQAAPSIFATAETVTTPDDFSGIADQPAAQAGAESATPARESQISEQAQVPAQDGIAATAPAQESQASAQDGTAAAAPAQESQASEQAQAPAQDGTAAAAPAKESRISEQAQGPGTQPDMSQGNPWAAIAEQAQQAAASAEAEPPAPRTATDGGSGLPPDIPRSDLPAEPEDDGSEEDGEGGRMSLMEHLHELRRRIMYSLAAAFVCFLACWAVVEPVFNVLTDPLLAVLPKGSTAMYTTLPEAFFTRMYIAFIVGLFVASPFIFYQIWAFISPGLYEEEKSFILPVAFISAIFFIAGGLFCYYIVFHYAFAFFVSFATEDIVAMPKISDYLDFVLKLLLAFGFIFEMPIFTFFLSRMGVVTAQKMRNVRRYAILIIFIVAAILTPPDVVSQLLMAVPMLLLYEVSIFVAALFGKKPAKDGPDSEDGADDEDDGAREDRKHAD